MAVVVFVLGLCFAAAGAMGLFMGYDLGGTERGVAYTISGSVALAAAGLLFGIATIAARLGTLIRLLSERPLPEMPLAGMAAPPAYAEMPRPVVVPRHDPADALDDHPVPAAAPTPLAPVLAGGAAAVATSAVLGRVFAKDATPVSEPEPAPAADPEFNFEDALAQELARTQPEQAAPPVVAELPPQEKAEPKFGLSLWDVKEEPAKSSSLADTGHHAAEAAETHAPEPVEDWLTAKETVLRGEEAKAPADDLPDDVFDDGFDEKPAHAEEPHVPKPAEIGMADAARTEDAEIDAAKAEALEVEDHHPEHAAPDDSSVLHSPEPGHEAHAVAEQPRLQPAAAADDPGRKVIGSYSVGSNHYTMYADGSVEAHTETGLYRFASLDELRHFIEKGTAAPAG